MCELLAMSANVPTDICFSFSGLIQRGGKTGPHRDGWGVTFYEGKGYQSFKDSLPSAESEVANLVTKYPIKSKTVICHIRQANSGAVCLENTHPFSRPLWRKHWTYAHNGQLQDFTLKLPLKNHFPVGTTDSEHAFCFILDKLNERFLDVQPPNNELFPFIANLCAEINQLGVFNLLFSNGEFLFVYCSNNLHVITRRAPFGHASLIDVEVNVDFKKETTEKDIVTIVATQPLTENERWEKLQAGHWQVFSKGEIIAKGS